MGWQDSYRRNEPVTSREVLTVCFLLQIPAFIWDQALVWPKDCGDEHGVEKVKRRERGRWGKCSIGCGVQDAGLLYQMLRARRWTDSLDGDSPFQVGPKCY